jgi:hypothetical protein
LERKEPSVATILTSFENSFDKYGALSTPLYQTATFKQVVWGILDVLSVQSIAV